MDPLEKRLRRQIANQGALTISQFISLCLADRQHGYYHHMMPFGREGDFITAPEISQMFGEMLGIWVVAVWKKLDMPADFIFCEMGPGRGTLMDDMLRTIDKICPNCLKAARITLVETSQRLRRLQAEKLKPYERLNLNFIEKLKMPKSLPLILIGNELLDCLPIHQYINTSTGWHERMVALDKQGRLQFSPDGQRIDASLLAPYGANQMMPEAESKGRAGTLIEISPAREALIEQLGQHITAADGVALFIDYGSLEGGSGDTLQAVSRHKHTHPLAAPGEHDLTSHVDFSALSRVAQQTGCASAAMTQGAFLTALGIQQRAERLILGHNKTFAKKTISELERLTAPHIMGELFKVFCLAKPDRLPVPFNQPEVYPLIQKSARYP